MKTPLQQSPISIGGNSHTFPSLGEEWVIPSSVPFVFVAFAGLDQASSTDPQVQDSQIFPCMIRPDKPYSFSVGSHLAKRYGAAHLSVVRQKKSYTTCRVGLWIFATKAKSVEINRNIKPAFLSLPGGARIIGGTQEKRLPMLGLLTLLSNNMVLTYSGTGSSVTLRKTQASQ